MRRRRMLHETHATGVNSNMRILRMVPVKMKKLKNHAPEAHVT